MLLKIKITTRNHLDSYVLFVGIAPHVLWYSSCRNSLFGSDLSKKVRGSDFSLWEQSTCSDPEIGNTSERSVMLKYNPRTALYWSGRWIDLFQEGLGREIDNGV